MIRQFQRPKNNKREDPVQALYSDKNTVFYGFPINLIHSWRFGRNQYDDEGGNKLRQLPFTNNNVRTVQERRNSWINEERPHFPQWGYIRDLKPEIPCKWGSCDIPQWKNDFMIAMYSRNRECSPTKTTGHRHLIALLALLERRANLYFIFFHGPVTWTFWSDCI